MRTWRPNAQAAFWAALHSGLRFIPFIRSGKRTWDVSPSSIPRIIPSANQLQDTQGEKTPKVNGQRSWKAGIRIWISWLLNYDLDENTGGSEPCWQFFQTALECCGQKGLEEPEGGEERLLAKLSYGMWWRILKRMHSQLLTPLAFPAASTAPTY